MSFEQIYKLSVVMSMVDNVTSPMRNAAGKVSESMGKMDALSQGFGDMTQQGMLMAGAGTQIVDAVLAPVSAAYETKRAIGELASVGVKDLTMLEDAAKDFSNTWAGTTKADFITAAYDIKSGISSLTDESVAQFTEMAGVTATATKSNIGTMTDLFATGYGIYKDFYADLSDLEFGEMFSAGIATSVEKFKTNGSEMASAVKSLGQSATNAQVPLEEQLSILGMLQATMSGSEAGTKYNAFLRSAAKGGKALGLNFLDANDQLLSMPEILSKLQGEFGETIDAAEKIKLQEAFGDSEAIKLIDLLYNKTGDLQDNILNLYDSMGRGMGAAASMAEAINKTDPGRLDVLKQSLHNTAETLGNTLSPKINEYVDKASGLITKADEWIGNHQELVGMLMQVALFLGAVLTVGGSTVATFGTMGLVFTKTIGTLGKLGAAISGIPDLFTTARIYGMLAGDKISWAFGMMKKGGLAALGGIRNFVVGMAGMAKQAVITAVQAMPGLISSVWGFTAALLANPITWIVIAIVALIAGLVLLYNKCEWFRNGVNAIWNVIKTGAAAIGTFFSGLFNGVRNAASNILSAAGETVSEKLGNIRQAYEANGGGIRGIAAGAMEAVKGYYTAGFDFMDKLTGGKLSDIADKVGGGMQKVKDKISESIAWFKESGKKVMSTFTDGIKETVMKPVEAVKGGLQKIRNMLPFSDAKTGPLDSLTLSGHRVLETVSTGIRQSEDLPAQAVERSFQKVDFAVNNKRETGKIKVPSEQPVDGDRAGSRGQERKTIIEKLVFNVETKKIDELKKLLKLLEEIEDSINSSNDEGSAAPV